VAQGHGSAGPAEWDPRVPSAARRAAIRASGWRSRPGGAVALRQAPPASCGWRSWTIRT